LRALVQQILAVERDLPGPCDERTASFSRCSRSTIADSVAQFATMPNDGVDVERP
jgi:hypothetical protein